MENKIGKEKIEGQIKFNYWENGKNPRPSIINGVLEVYINGVTYYGKLIERIPIYEGESWIAFRMGKEIFECLAYDLIITG